MGIPSDENAVAAANMAPGMEVQGVAPSQNMQPPREHNTFEPDSNHMAVTDFNLLSSFDWSTLGIIWDRSGWAGPLPAIQLGGMIVKSKSRPKRALYTNHLIPADASPFNRRLPRTTCNFYI